VRLAVLLLWVRAHVAAPFWQQYIAQLPMKYTTSGEAWSPGALAQLQWPVFQVWYAVQEWLRRVRCVCVGGGGEASCRCHSTVPSVH
jgi:hypothetical protein